MANKGEIEMSKANERPGSESIESLCSGAKDDPAIEANVQGTAILGARNKILRMRKDALHSFETARKNGLTDPANYYWGVYCGLSYAAGIVFRESKKMLQHEGTKPSS
jgi:hypothetical protein